MSERGGELEGEDAKLVLLARAARTRAFVVADGGAAAEGAAVRDVDGRTYSAATVEHATLGTSALRGAVVAAVSSGARGFEAAVVVGDDDGAGSADMALLAAFGAGVPVYLVSGDGRVRTAATT